MIGFNRHMHDCKAGKYNYGLIHPWKLDKQSYSHWSEVTWMEHGSMYFVVEIFYHMDAWPTVQFLFIA